MSKRLIIFRDQFSTDYQEIFTNDIVESLKREFPDWPSTAKLYHENVSQITDITPRNLQQQEKLGTLDGTFIVVCFAAAGYPILQQIAIMIAMQIISQALFAPKKPTLTPQRNAQVSSNNDLTSRTNKMRLGGRIPDIYGTVKSIPDILSSYTIWENHSKVEYSYSCIGRGYYDITPDNIFEGDTRYSDITDSSCQIYAPNTSPNSGAVQLQIGAAITEPLKAIKRISNVNGQLLEASNINTFVGSENVSISGNVITLFEYTKNLFNSTTGRLSKKIPTDFTKLFNIGDHIRIENLIAYHKAYDYSIPSVLFTRYTGFGGYVLKIMGLGGLPAWVVTNRTVYIESAGKDSYNETTPLVGSFIISSSSYLSGTLTLNLIDSNTSSSTLSFWSEVNDNSSPVLVLSVYDRISNSEVYTNVDYNGTYTISGVTSSTITLDNPSSVNASWGTLYRTGLMSPTISTTADKYTNWTVIQKKNIKQIWANFVAPQGLFKDDGINQSYTEVAIKLEIQPLDINLNPLGAAISATATIDGSATETNERGKTLKVNVDGGTYYKCRAVRLTGKDTGFQGTVVDQCNFADLLAVFDVPEPHFGNVTTAYTKFVNTKSALQIKERELNIKCTRKLPYKVTDTTFSTDVNNPNPVSLVATNNAADILCAMTLDSFNGNGLVSDLDIANIYQVSEDVSNYFGISGCREFNYTFDDPDMSFEEQAIAVAEAIFCRLHRRGNKMYLLFENAEQEPTILINHRNVIPNSTTYGNSFGGFNLHDGVVYKYVTIDNEATEILIPSDGSAIRPKEIQSAGVNAYVQAYAHAYRLWNEMQYKNTVLDCSVLPEIDLVPEGGLFYATDNTFALSQDGEVLGVNGLTLTLSQPCDLTQYLNYHIQLQLYNGTIQSIPVSAGSNAYEVVMGYSPALPVVTDNQRYAKTTYCIVGATEDTFNVFVLKEKRRKTDGTVDISAVQYDNRFYQNDLDHLQGVLWDSGNTLWDNGLTKWS